MVGKVFRLKKKFFLSQFQQETRNLPIIESVKIINLLNYFDKDGDVRVRGLKVLFLVENGIRTVSLYRLSYIKSW